MNVILYVLGIPAIYFAAGFLGAAFTDLMGISASSADWLQWIAAHGFDYLANAMAFLIFLKVFFPEMYTRPFWTSYQCSVSRNGHPVANAMSAITVAGAILLAVYIVHADLGVRMPSALAVLPQSGWAVVKLSALSVFFAWLSIMYTWEETQQDSGTIWAYLLSVVMFIVSMAFMVASWGYRLYYS